MVARLGRFGLVSLSVATRRSLPRKSPTRRLLKGSSEDLDPQQKLWMAEKASLRGATESAYFGCMMVRLENRRVIGRTEPCRSTSPPSPDRKSVV